MLPWGIRLVLIAIFAAAGYQRAQYFERRYGRTPWGWRPWGWAIVMGLSLVIGIVLLAIAERTGRIRAELVGPAQYSSVPPRPLP